MNRVRFIKYASIFSLPITVWFALTYHGWITYLSLIQAFVLIPFLELFIAPNEKNLKDAETELIKDDILYDLLLYSILPIQYGFLVYFLFSIQEPLLWWETLGRISAFGILCGVLGINVAHELGHRKSKFERGIAKLLLLSSLYMHFYIEHNRGHHRNVSTDLDPASSRLNESLYAFWIRSIVYSYFSAWKLEAERLKKKNLSIVSIHNEMIVFQFIQLGLVLTIGFLFGLKTLLYFFATALIGILLLETVNYIEHYGLRRKKTENDLYERVKPIHSWNSNHIIGRIMLFELSRHSDHHFKASKKFQVLEHHDNSPQMPTGYPGMMILSTIPPLWFWVMNARIKKFI
jgi:alkane 1-monooxygenase